MVSALRIDAVILHGIVKSVRGEKVAPDLSDEESDLSPRIRGFLQQQVQEALKFGRQIVEIDGLSTVPGLIREFWSGQQDLVTSSRALAQTLQDNQPVVSPEGLLMVADATVNDRKVFVIAKLEHEKGAQARREPNEAGHMVYTMNFLDDLFFTTGSRVFKIGYFPKESGLLDGLVVDRQVAGHAVARYFREDYLGCGWKERPELVTERFMDTVQAWIDTIKDTEKRSRYQVGLISELQSQSNGLSVHGFAVQHVDVGDRDAFERHARQSLPAAEIPKNLELVRARLATVRIDTASGAIIMAPPERMRDGTVTVESDGENGKNRIIVEDDITKTSGTGTFKP